MTRPAQRSYLRESLAKQTAEQVAVAAMVAKAGK
jgi:hypothetical protein